MRDLETLLCFEQNCHIWRSVYFSVWPLSAWLSKTLLVYLCWNLWIAFPTFQWTRSMEFYKYLNIICLLTCVFIVFALGLNLFSDLICNNIQSSDDLSIHCLGFSNSEVSRIISNWAGYTCDGLGRPCCLEAQRCSWRNQECKLQHCQVPQGEMFCHYTYLPIFSARVNLFSPSWRE